MASFPVAALTAFHVVGGAAAAWAVVLAFLGLSRHEFPRKGGERIVIAISALLVAGSIGTAIGTATQGPKAGGVEPIVTRNGQMVTQGSHPTSSTQPRSAPAPAASAGTSATPPSSGGASHLSLTADPSGALKFNTTALQAKAGTVRLTLSNPAPLAHNVALRGPGVTRQGATVAQGGTSVVTATLKPGTYTFFCSQPGHEAAGMKGTLTVK